MANLIKWAGQSVSLTISNKALNNTGIKSVAGECSYNGSYFIQDTVTSISNANAGNIAASVVTFSTFPVTAENYGAGLSIAHGTPSFVVEWNSGGKTHALNAPVTLELRMPADRVSTGVVSGTYYWLDEEISFRPTISHTANVIPYSADTAKVNVASSTYFNAVSATANAYFKMSLNTNATFDAVTYIPVSVSTVESETFSAEAAGPVVLSNTNDFYVRNSVKQVELNDSVSDTQLYVTKGSSATINYTVIPVQKGTAYSYAVTLVQTPSASVVDMTLTNASSAKKGTVTFEGLQVGTTKLQLKSTAHSSGNIVSPVVTIYVSSDVTEIYLNCGDSYEWEIPSGVTYSVDNSFVNVNDTVKPGKLVISALSEDGTSVVTLSTGAKLTVHIDHLTITLA